MKPRVILIDDDMSLNEILAAHLTGAGYLVSSFVDPAEGIDRLAQGDFDLVITDMKMEPFDGLRVLEEAKKVDPEVPVIMITAHATVENAVQSMKLGAYDYITKPFSREEFLHTVANAVDYRTLREENKSLRRDLSARYDFSSIIGRSSAMAQVYDLMEKALDNDVTVLITGESGTGKELVAKAIHYNGSRREKPFVVVNCASIPDTLIESELFGHVRGAFTGALRDRRGKFESADGGTIFLDEIGDLKIELQSKLLRVLQEGEVERVGEGKPYRVNVRVIAATHKDLEDLVEHGLFREDLYYRVSVFPIHLPLLRERREDIPLLVEHFLEKHGASLPSAALSRESLELLIQYDWPGNVRELENVIERALVLSKGVLIGHEHLPPRLTAGKRQESRLLDLPDEGIRLEELEKSLIERALERAGGNRARAARLLGISRPTLIYRIEKYGLGGGTKSDED